MTSRNITAEDRLIFALDVADCGTARELVAELDDAVTFYKIGLELMMSGGYFELLEWLWYPGGWYCRAQGNAAPKGRGRSIRRGNP